MKTFVRRPRRDSGSAAGSLAVAALTAEDATPVTSQLAKSSAPGAAAAFPSGKDPYDFDMDERSGPALPASRLAAPGGGNGSRQQGTEARASPAALAACPAPASAALLRTSPRRDGVRPKLASVRPVLTSWQVLQSRPAPDHRD